MARNSISLQAAPEAVWALLEDPWAYPKWIVGTDHTVSATADWPNVGTDFKVKLPFGLVDRTDVRELDRGRRIVLHAASGIFGPARVTITLEPEGAGTRLTLVEDPAGKLAPLRYAPPVHLAIRLRNVESLRRLRRLVDGAGA